MAATGICTSICVSLCVCVCVQSSINIYMLAAHSIQICTRRTFKFQSQAKTCAMNNAEYVNAHTHTHSLCRPFLTCSLLSLLKQMKIMNRSILSSFCRICFAFASILFVSSANQSINQLIDACVVCVYRM